MPSDKNKVVRYTGSDPSQRGDIQYWDGNNWIPLANGSEGQWLTAHGIGLPPTWENPPEPPVPPVVLPSVPFDQPLGLNSQTNSLAREEVHLVMQPKGATETRDRAGNIYQNVEGPFAAPWNWDDNNSGNELLYFGFEDPLTNKYIGVSYTQTKYSTFGYYISEIRVKTYEISGDNTDGSILSGGSKQYIIESDGVFDITCDNTGNVTGSLVGTLLTSSSSSSSITSVDFTLPPPDQSFPMIPDPPNKLTIDIPLFTLEISFIPGGPFTSYSMNLVPKTTYLQESIYAGGKIGGLWYRLMEKIRDYGDNGGFVSQTGVPVPTLNSSSSNVVVGCWGWYGSESSSSSQQLPAPHFIPINRISDDFNIDINEFIGTDARLGFEAANVVENVASYVNSISFFEANVIAIIWNLIQDPNSKGYWKLENWCDPSLRISGDTICCLNGEPVPAMQVTVSGNGPGGTNTTINWCGETWTPSEDGDTKLVCPTNYKKIKRKQTGTFDGNNTTAYWAKQSWVNINDGGLNLKRQYYILRDYGLGSDWNWLIGTWIENKVSLTGYRDYAVYVFPNGITQRPIPKTQFYSINPPYFSVGVLSLGNPGTPSFDDAYLTDDFFGSFSNAGITYTWIKGNGWNSF
jgi:hypothetical protein